MSDSTQIYQNSADRYHALVAREDYKRNLLPAISAIIPLKNKVVVELGAGTGRVSCLLTPLVQRLIAGDRSFHMLSYGKQNLTNQGLENWHLFLESHLALPFPTDTADVVIAGWSFCYAAIDSGKDWQSSLEKALGEASRVLRPGGMLILIESLGTGFTKPSTPPVLVDYLNYLGEHDFQSTWIRTDYCFKDRAEAENLTHFFFGEGPMPMWETEAGVIVPECTGLWWRKFNG